MKLMIDANILLDVLQNRTKYVKDSSNIWKLCEIGKAQGIVSALSFANLIYIMRKEIDAKKIRDILKKISLIFSIAELNQKDLENAASISLEDYEDAIQLVTAKRCCADYIITRNTKDFKDSPIPSITPSDFLQIFS